MYHRLLVPPKNKSFFLFGPRGTGKTTWVKAAFPDSIYLDLLEAKLFNELLADPQRLEKFIPKDHKGFVILDEIQRVPELLNEVHRLIENRGDKFILTGSSARKLRKKGQNLLGGRALTYHMHPLSAVEAGKDFNLRSAVAYGSLPSVFKEENVAAYLESYVKTYLEEEIRQEGLTRNIGMFSRFLESASFSQGGILNISSVARDCSVERKVVESYFNILEELLIAHKVPVFAKKAKRRLLSHPKFYIFDTGVFRAIRPKGPLDLPEEIEGASFETLFFQNIIAVNDSLHLGYKPYYWRTSSGLEVDFILYGDKGVIAFEVKRTSKIRAEMFNGLKSFLKDYPMAKAYFVYGGNRRMSEGKIEVLPMEEALMGLVKILGKSK